MFIRHGLCCTHVPFPTTSTWWGNGRQLPNWHREWPLGFQAFLSLSFFSFFFFPLFFFSLFAEPLRHLHLVSWNVKRCVSHLLQELARFRLWWISGKSQFRSWGPTTENIYLFKLFIAFLKNSSLYYLSVSQKLKVHHELKVYHQHPALPARKSCRALRGVVPRAEHGGGGWGQAKVCGPLVLRARWGCCRNKLRRQMGLLSTRQSFCRVQQSAQNGVYCHSGAY